MLNNTHLTLGNLKTTSDRVRTAWSCYFSCAMTAICLAQVKDGMMQSYDFHAWTPEN